MRPCLKRINNSRLKKGKPSVWVFSILNCIHLVAFVTNEFSSIWFFSSFLFLKQIPSMWPYVFRLLLCHPPDAGIIGVPHTWLGFQFYAEVFCFLFVMETGSHHVDLFTLELTSRPRWPWTHRDLAAFASEHWDQDLYQPANPLCWNLYWSWNEFVYSIGFVFYSLVCSVPFSNTILISDTV